MNASDRLIGSQCVPCHAETWAPHVIYLWAPRRVCPPTSAGGWTVDLVADRVGSRFKQLARLVGRSGSIVRR